jgi:amino acid transporter
VGATVVNTGYLYLLFFGFQEIQALDRETRERSGIPLLWRLGKRFQLEKPRFVGIAMVVTVIIAASVNLFYALAVYAANPSRAGLSASQIPALYVAETVLGRDQASLTALAFMIATFTTFVPAFMAASRHIGALGDDGFLPRGVGRASWLLVLVSIGFLAVAGQDFLVSITDFMVLVSLGLIALAGIWLRRNRRRLLERKDLLSLGVGAACYVAAGVLYGVTPSVAVFGSLSIAVAFLIYDMFELGSLGSRLFVAALCVVSYGLLVLYPGRFPSPGLLPFNALEEAVRTTLALRTGLLVGAVGLLVSALLELLVRRLRRDAQHAAADGGRRRG